jgi:hypothetical protein
LNSTRVTRSSANHLGDVGDVQPEAMVPWCAEPDDEPHEARPWLDAVEVGRVR